ncbi:hypothetical protein VR41_14910, partial [Streptomyces sp. NRRL B-1568]
MADRDDHRVVRDDQNPPAGSTITELSEEITQAQRHIGKGFATRWAIEPLPHTVAACRLLGEAVEDGRRRQQL